MFNETSEILEGLIKPTWESLTKTEIPKGNIKVRVLKDPKAIEEWKRYRRNDKYGKVTISDLPEVLIQEEDESI